VIGTRNTLKGLLMALLEPRQMLIDAEMNGDYTTRLALLEELKVMPHGAVWDMFCQQQGTPVGIGFMDEIRRYERDVLRGR